MKLAAALLLLLPALASSAQDSATPRLHTLFSQPGDTITGGFFTLTALDLHLLGQDGFLLGGRAGVTVGHRWSIGLAGYGLCNPPRNNAYNEYREQHNLAVPDGLGFRLGYGGLFIERTILDHSLVHLTIPVTFGGGGASYGHLAEGVRYRRLERTDAQVFFFVEPALELEVNVLQALRLGVGAAFLYTSAISLPATPADLLDRPMLRVSLKAGQF